MREPPAQGTGAPCVPLAGLWPEPPVRHRPQTLPLSCAALRPWLVLSQLR